MHAIVEPGQIAVVPAPSGLTMPAAADWITEHLDMLHATRLEHGAVLLRGLPFTSPVEFGELRDRLIHRPAAYVEKATPRSAFGNGVFTATDVPARRRIRLHNENSYALRFPALLVFGCLTAPSEGGATFLGDVRRVLSLLPPAIVDDFRTRGWMLVRNYWGHFGLTWQEAFSTTDPAEVARYAEAEGLTVSWPEEGRLQTTQRRSATIRHPLTGDECWFNHVAFWSEWSLEDGVRDALVAECGSDLPFMTRYGDGEPVPRAVVEEINAALGAVRVAEPWRVGDIMLVDNVRMAHGRDPFRGERRVLVGMGDPVERDTCEL
jgi:alpha-ketoglutarate-dependent taurine dioxygenase